MMPSNFISVGQRLTNYANHDITVERIAHGGMGLVAFGPDRAQNNRMTALKTIMPGLLARSPRLQQLFIREALTWIGLWPHPNLITGASLIVIDDVPFLVLDYAEKGSLRDVLSSSQPLPTRFLWAQHIAAGLLALHTPDPAFLRPWPVVHRDLKPENVLIMKDRTPVSDMVVQLLTQSGNVEKMEGGIVAYRNQEYAAITDFGLAKVAAEAQAENVNDEIHPEDSSADSMASRAYRTARGVAMGTFAYMPPEQWDDAALTGPPADIYALGLILSELMTGQLGITPEQGTGLQAWREAHRQQTPRPLRDLMPTLPPKLEQLYLACLAKDPTDRPTAQEVLSTLQLIAPEVEASPYTPREIIPHTPQNELAKWDNWAQAYLLFGMAEEALQRNTRALALAPNDYVTLSSRAAMLQKLGRFQEALATIDFALAIMPADEAAHGRGIALNVKGGLLSRMQRYDEADKVIAQAIQIKPGDAVIWENRAHNQLAWAVAEHDASHKRSEREHLQLSLQCAQQALQVDARSQTAREQIEILRAILAKLGK